MIPEKPGLRVKLNINSNLSKEKLQQVLELKVLCSLHSSASTYIVVWYKNTMFIEKNGKSHQYTCNTQETTNSLQILYKRR